MKEKIYLFLDKVYKHRKKVIALGVLIQFGFTLLRGLLSIILSQ